MRNAMRRVVFIVLAAVLLGPPGPTALAQGSDPCGALEGDRGQACQPLPLEPEMLEQFLSRFGDPCGYWAAQNAVGPLMMARSVTPAGMWPYGWAPLAGPFHAGPVGPATLFSPPGALPVYGPLGPGQTAYAIAASALPPQGIRPTGVAATDFQNALTLVALGGLQQTELGNLYGRYGLSGVYQLAGGFLSQAYAAQASSMLPILQALCRSQQRQFGGPGN
jgi:hypothetical protein